MNKYYKLIHYNSEEIGPLQLKNISGVAAGFSMVLGGNGTVPSYTPDLEYSLDGTTWTAYDFTNLPTITVPVGGQIYLRGTNTTGFNGNNNYYWHFHMDQDYDAIGNMLSVIDYTNLNTITSVSTLGSLVGFFDGETHLIHAHQSNYGSTINSIGRYGLNFVFRNCTNLLTPPNLSTWKVTTATQALFLSMFEGCSSLKDCPDFNTITSAGDETFKRAFALCTSIITPPIFNSSLTLTSGQCFLETFYGCTSLKYAPEINEIHCTSDWWGAYKQLEAMFKGCTSLVKGLDLRNFTTFSTEWICKEMYYGCSSLKIAYAPNFTTALHPNGQYNNWLYGVPSGGTLYLPYDVVLPISASGVPSNWTVEYY